jgi:hypothetical protein
VDRGQGYPHQSIEVVEAVCKTRGCCNVKVFFAHETHEMHEKMNIFVALLNLFTLSQTD